MNTVQPQPSTQALQPVAGVAPPVAGGSRVGTITRSRFHWSHALLAVGILAVSGAGTVIVIKVIIELHIILSRAKHFMIVHVLAVV